MKRTKLKRISDTGKEKRIQKQQETEGMYSFFYSVWNEREKVDPIDDLRYVICYETGKKMHRAFYRNNSCIYHHCLPKAQYPQYKFTKANILLILPEVHSQIHTNPSKCPKVLEYTNNLIKLHENGEL